MLSYRNTRIAFLLKSVLILVLKLSDPLSQDIFINVRKKNFIQK